METSDGSNKRIHQGPFPPVSPHFWPSFHVPPLADNQHILLDMVSLLVCRSANHLSFDVSAIHLKTGRH